MMRVHDSTSQTRRVTLVNARKFCDQHGREEMVE